MDAEQRARLEGNLAHPMPYGNCTVLCGDLAALLAALTVAEAENAEMKRVRRFGLGDIRTLCGIISASGPHGEPLACGYPLYHEGHHSWATLPTPGVAEAAERAARLDALAQAARMWHATRGVSNPSVRRHAEWMLENAVAALSKEPQRGES